MGSASIALITQFRQSSRNSEGVFPRKFDATRLSLSARGSASRTPFPVATAVPGRTRIYEPVSHEASSTRYLDREERRFALALQMADLDQRREILRKRRGDHSVNRIVEDRIVAGQNTDIDVITSAVKLDPSVHLELEKGLYTRCCAKAA
eukprot:TRINITY_DN1620_c0_g1_i1.p1 TRINITY_DN1620_c0_g1~~TRINITY_DN1620_c0_g1_i1.p1  ORF type:complete len:150 (+),score=14.68 TRINITY_DN1620_c0_g1_i1:171-620(+)